MHTLRSPRFLPSNSYSNILGKYELDSHKKTLENVSLIPTSTRSVETRSMERVASAHKAFYCLQLNPKNTSVQPPWREETTWPVKSESCAALSDCAEALPHRSLPQTSVATNSTRHLDEYYSSNFVSWTHVFQSWNFERSVLGGIGADPRDQTLVGKLLT